MLKQGFLKQKYIAYISILRSTFKGFIPLFIIILILITHIVFVGVCGGRAEVGSDRPDVKGPFIISESNQVTE